MTDTEIHQTLNGGAIAGVVGGFAGLTINEWLGLGAFVLAALTLAVNIWHKRKMVRLREKEIEIRRLEASK